VSFEDLVTSLTPVNYVDADDWRGHWSHGYCVYADLLAFRDKCEHSEPTTVNALVRFHRAVLHAQNSGVQVYRFTDATFATSHRLWPAFTFAIRLLHACLAMNAVILRRRHSVAQHLFLPRVTLAGGRLLRVVGPTDGARATGIDPRTFLAGTAVISAYDLEHDGVAFGLTLSQALAKNILELRLRGDQKHSARPFLGSIRAQLQDGRLGLLGRGKVFEWPWLLCSAAQSHEDMVWGDDRASIKAKLSALYEIATLMGAEFVTQSLSLQTAHHQAGLRRHLYALAALMSPSHIGRYGDVASLRELIGTIRG
jgi:hypothetical protein